MGVYMTKQLMPAKRMSMRNLVSVSSCLLMLVAGAGHQSTAQSPNSAQISTVSRVGKSASPPVPQSLRAQLRSARGVMDGLRRDGFSGAVAVVKDGKLIFVDASGEARQGARFTPGTKVDIASIAKPVTTMAVFKLAQQGRLSLDDTIGRWLADAPEDKKAITLRQLLSHTAGIADGIEGVTDYTRITTEETADRLLKEPLDFTPGSKYSYSNGGFVVVTAIVQKASGERLEDFLQREIFAPAGVSASYDPTKFPARQVADGRSYYEGEWIKVRDTAAASKGPFGYLWGDGGLFISAPDLARLIDAYFSGKVVDQRWVDEAWRPVVRIGGLYQEGLGWVISDLQRGTKSARYTGGSSHSVTAASYYPEARLTVVALANKAVPSGTRAAKELAAAFVGSDFGTRPPLKAKGEVVAPNSQEARLARNLAQILNAFKAEKAKFVADNFTPEARANGGADSILQELNASIRVGRPRIISVTKPTPGTLQIIGETPEFNQQVFWQADLETVMQGGRLLIKKIDMNLK